MDSLHACGEYLYEQGCEFLLAEARFSAMLEDIQPKIVLVHDYMPDDIFGEYTEQIKFHRYASQFERTHSKEGM